MSPYAMVVIGCAVLILLERIISRLDRIAEALEKRNYRP